ncbi:TIGR02679 domain-containing protein [Amycolatopsis alkalitolerans]|uniref:DUF2399 domain-containing protein n=1 Tax=Amycolatopsis alkalitolerans TaxID=2547244 RepID=A0A5C4LYU0_9PSEU|nr:TIGR02679 domain-containing protein [Amycolatopsis alkalitolerans]TNC25057.1 DUF2399 domain-containing protein [Amycolatopsis alkalitolerans]
MSPAVPAWLADPALEPVWRRLAEALEKRGLTPTGIVEVTGLDRAGRHAVSGLVGKPVHKDRVRIDLTTVDIFLRERSGIGGLRSVVEAVRGAPLVDRPALRSARSASREAPYVTARAWLAAHPDANLAWADEWLAGLRRTGYLRRRPNAVALVERALEVLADRFTAGGTGNAGVVGVDAEPSPVADGRSADVVSRVELAARVCGDAHALDADRPLAHLVLRGIAAAHGIDVSASAAGRRNLWERAGVRSDSVSSTCLTFGVRDGVRHLTPWDLARTPVRPVPGADVLVCENPRVLEAFAERRREVIVVCTAGEPNLVTLDVLRALRGTVTLRYHGDFDWPGIAIANRLVHTLDVQPWLMTAADYRDAVDALRDRLDLGGAPVIPAWDPDLGEAMTSAGVAVHEESVLDTLVATF